MRRFLFAAAFLVATPLVVQGRPTGFQGGSALTLTANDGVQEEWIRVTRACPGPASSCDNGRGGFSSQIERSPGLERLGSASGTFYAPHSATVRFTA